MREVAAAQQGRELAQSLAQARAAIESGRALEARQILEVWAATVPNNGRVWVLLAETERQLGDSTAALVSADRALAVGSPEERCDAQVTAGLVEVSRGRMLPGAQRFAAARTLDPTFTMAWVLEVHARLDGGDAAGARAAMRSALAANPNDAELATLARQLPP